MTGWQVACPDYRLPKIYPATEKGRAQADAHAVRMDAEAKCGHQHAVVAAVRT